MNLYTYRQLYVTQTLLRGMLLGGIFVLTLFFMQIPFAHAEPDWEDTYDGGGTSYGGGGGGGGGHTFKVRDLERWWSPKGGRYDLLTGSVWDEESGGDSWRPPVGRCTPASPDLRVYDSSITFEEVGIGSIVSADALQAGKSYVPIVTIRNNGCTGTDNESYHQDNAPFGINGGFPVRLRIDFNNDGSYEETEYKNNVGPIARSGSLSVRFPAITMNTLGTHKIETSIDLKDSDDPGHGCAVATAPEAGDWGCILERISRAYHDASKTFTVTDPAPGGDIEFLGSRYRGIDTSCTLLRGWVCDPSAPEDPVQITIEEGGVPIASTYASTKRPDTYPYMSCIGREWRIPTPLSLKDGTPHTIKVRAHNIGIAGSANDTYMVSGVSWARRAPKSFTVNCPAASPAVDLAASLGYAGIVATGEDASFEVTSTNVGTLPADKPYRVVLQLRYGEHPWSSTGAYPDDFMESTVFSNTLAPSEKQSETITTNFSKTGTWYARLVVDSGRVYDEETKGLWANNATDWSAFEVVNIEPPKPDCDDGVDNDADGKTDYPNDPGCTSPTDDTEEDPIVPLADPTITVTPPLVRVGDEVTVSWDPKGHPGCTLSARLSGDASTAGSETFTATAQTTLSITCSDGSSDSVTVKVLPILYET